MFHDFYRNIFVKIDCFEKKMIGIDLLEIIPLVVRLSTVTVSTVFNRNKLCNQLVLCLSSLLFLILPYIILDR